MDPLLKRTLNELGFLDKNGNPERDKDKRWRVNVNEAELILKDLMTDIKILQKKESEYRFIIDDLQRILYTLLDGLKENIAVTEKNIEASLERARQMGPYSDLKALVSELEARERMDKLSKVVLYHQKKYHEEDMPEISDEVYDSLVRELRELEARYPELKAKDSPSDRVGGEPK